MEYKFQISIIIVNYNVSFFLEQCLNSCYKALKNVSGEIFVVDNNSSDDSLAMLEEKFSQVNVIANKENVGFSKANNQAIRISSGKYVLLLNPDTVVQEDSFEKVIYFMEQHHDAGGLGVRMLDGTGEFLPESKRGLPTPMVAFYKIFGLSALFPKSKMFGKYHLAYLSEHENHEVDILSGAFMLMRKAVLDEVGLLDETFFMYGEDVDLSYRIQLGGYKNYYCSDTSIIHYKGESTKKSSVNYVFVFYRAMVIFAKKHFNQNYASLFSFLINFAIYLRASTAIFSRFLKKLVLPFMDFTFLTSGMFLMTRYWHVNGIVFPQNILKYSIPAYVFVWILSLFYTGLYDKPFKWKKIVYGNLLGLALILIFYGLLSKEFQFSRLFILISSVWLFTYFVISRIILHWFFPKKFKLNTKINHSFAIVGEKEEALRVQKMLIELNPSIEKHFFISLKQSTDSFFTASLAQLDDLISKEHIEELIFCAKNVSNQEIIAQMGVKRSGFIEYKIAQPESLFLIGSNSIHSAGDTYVLHVNELSKTSNIRLKRTLDVIVSFFMLATFPFWIFSFKDKLKFLKNMFQVLLNRKTLIGYIYNDFQETMSLPKLKEGVLKIYTNKIEDEKSRLKLNLIYARDYSIFKDIEILSKSWRSLAD